MVDLETLQDLVFQARSRQAAEGDGPDAVRLLLERGARTDLKSSNIAGVMTPLELAIRYNRTEIAEILKQASEKIDANPAR